MSAAAPINALCWTILTFPGNPHGAAIPATVPFFGLAPFLRMSIAGIDLSPLGQQMLAEVDQYPGEANRWMNLAIVMQCLGQRDLGLACQRQALALTRFYRLAASEQPARLRLLLLVVPGDLAANMPLECLLEEGDIDLDFYYLTPDAALPLSLPEHDLLVVAVSEAEQSRALLAELVPALATWPKPVINAPQYISAVGRAEASARLQHVPGLLVAPTWRLTASQLLAVATMEADLPALCPNCVFPVIVRPVGSHGGHDLDKIDSPAALAAYLGRVEAGVFYLAPFIDYSSEDGYFRKMRIALVDGEAFACHMAISAHWMIHYVNAGMYEEAWKREEEAAFMAGFTDFARRHRTALAAVYERTGLDYLCIDCAETRGGRLLVFEIDHAMVVHAMDPPAQFPYKQAHMQKVKNAFRQLLLRRLSAPAESRQVVSAECSLG